MRKKNEFDEVHSIVNMFFCKNGMCKNKEVGVF